MSYKTPRTAYINRLIKTTGRQDLRKILANSPLKMQDAALLADYADGLTYKELAVKYGISCQNVYQRKRRAYDQLYFYMTKK